MTNYTITVTEAELDVVRLALGRMIEPRKVAERKPAGVKAFSHGKPPKLGDAARRSLERRWAEAVERAAERPGRWADDLADRLTNRNDKAYMGYGSIDAVKRAWGISA